MAKGSDNGSDNGFDLDALFSEAAQIRTPLADDLTVRILSDAAKAQPSPQAFAKPVIYVKRPSVGWFSGLGDVLGVRSIVGLSLAGLTGLYLGVAQPAAVQSLNMLLSGSGATVAQMDLLPATGTLWTED